MFMYPAGRQLPFPALILFTAFCVVLFSSNAQAVSKNGFILDEASIPVDQIKRGGPPRDGIPALYFPDFIEAQEAAYLNATDRVLGVIVNGVAKAYPIAILDWHEVVNDRVEEQHFAVTYCPLCGTGMVFASNFTFREQDTNLLFGVSGLLYESDVLLYDRQTESLWSQILGKAVSGPFMDTVLPQLPVFHTRWENWRDRHPDTLVLSDRTGAGRDYKRSPYAGYEQSRRLYFSVNNRAPDDYHPKERVLGVEVDGVFKAYPFSELSAAGREKIEDRLNDKTLTILWDEAADSAHVVDASGRDYVSLVAYWFAWYTFHPETLVFRAED